MNDWTFAPLRLKKSEERRLKTGHLWVFSNEIDTVATPLTQFAPGQPVQIENHLGQPLATGYVNSQSLISARVFSRDPEHPFSPSLLVHRLNIALGLRKQLFSQPFYRLAFSEADGLPGLIVDRYGDYCVAQITTAGLDRLQPELVAALDKVLKPKGILWRNDSPMRELEGLPLAVTLAAGEVPPTVTVEEGGVRFTVDLWTGQKTGWFFDQRENRQRLSRYVKPQGRVLDVCCYQGAWGLQAARQGASVVFVDSSAAALARVQENAAANGLSDRITCVEGDVFEVLRDMRQAREKFDAVILDPPAFIKRGKDAKAGVMAYRRLNEMALRLLEKQGFLISCSCSQHFSADDLKTTVFAAARHEDRQLTLLDLGQQSPDHPIHPAMPETAYLKALYARVLAP